MKRIHFILFLALAAAAQAHFTFILPHAGGETADLVLSENLASDAMVDVTIARKAGLKVRDASGADTAVELAEGPNRLVMRIPGHGMRTIHGVADMGVTQMGRAPKPFLLLYYPKTIVGPAFASQAKVGGAQVVELVPGGEPGHVTLQFLVRGQPRADSEMTVILPDGSQQKAKTNGEGIAGPFTQAGRYGAWARFFEPVGGERDGKAYSETRHYGMLVFDAHAKPAAMTPMPEGAASFGAVADNGWVYVYGGHVATTHVYSKASVSGQFHRMRANGEGGWQALAPGEPVQGMNVVAHGGKIYRVGGMAPRNEKGAPADNHSVASVARFDPAANKWEELPPLPEARSSHDAVVIGDKLIVAGGWTMKGAVTASTWAKSVFVLDLAATQPAWQTIAQPFERRAFIAAAHDGRLYLMGGITPAGSVTAEVEIFDPATGAWTKGTALPGPAKDSFAPAAADHRGQLIVSLADGGVYRMIEKPGREAAWETVGWSTPRLAHRMVSAGDAVLILGGASKGKNANLVEAVTMAR